MFVGFLIGARTLGRISPADDPLCGEVSELRPIFKPWLSAVSEAATGSKPGILFLGRVSFFEALGRAIAKLPIFQAT